MKAFKSVLLALAVCLVPCGAFAQAPAASTTGLVVAVCGATSPFAAYVAGRSGPITIDPTGVLCTTAGGGGGGDATAANQVLQIAQETAINTILGLQADAACSTDNGTCTIAALSKRGNQRLTTINTTLGTPFQAGGSIGNTTFGATLNATPTIANGNGTVAAPSTEALAAIAHSTSVTAAESCRVLKNSPGNLYGLRVSIAATTGYVMLFDATSAPGDGAVTTLAIPAVRVVSDGTSGWYADDFSPPMRLGTGITVCFSSTGPFSKTASATAAISGQVQ